jgi:hypothetical protein
MSTLVCTAPIIDEVKLRYQLRWYTSILLIINWRILSFEKTFSDCSCHLTQYELSQQVFSITGLITNVKETMVSSGNVENIYMIHDSYNLLEKI